MPKETPASKYFGTAPRMLGKLKPVNDPRTLKLAAYMKSVPPAPKAFDPDSGNKLFAQGGWGNLLNDSLGDCTCAGMGHIIEWWMALAAKQSLVIPDAAVLKAYEDVAGYDPLTGQNDNGADLVSCLNYWRDTGVYGHKIGAFASIDFHQPAAIRQSTWLFGASYTGVALPIACQDMGDRWDIPVGQATTGDWEPYSWGGHCVPIISYDEGVCAIVTWGKRVKVTWRFMAAYFDEVFAPLSMDWIAGSAAPNGFNVAALQDDIRQLNWSESILKKKAV